MTLTWSSAKNAVLNVCAHTAQEMKTFTGGKAQVLRQEAERKTATALFVASLIIRVNLLILEQGGNS